MVPSYAADTRLRPFEALRAVRRLLNHPDDTGQVFIVLRAMRGRSGVRLFRRFMATPTGAAVLRERRCLLDRLSDAEALAMMPQSSLGRAYLDFMAGEALSADGLVQASRASDARVDPPPALIFRDRVRDMHDLTHVLTGYRRDPLGELCLLAFNHAQTGHIGMAMIVLMGLARFGRGPGGGAARRAVFQAWRNGRRADWLAEQDWEALLAESVDGLRQSLKIAEPSQYSRLAS